MAGRKSVFAEEARAGGYIGADFDINIDLAHKLPDNWREFNKEFIPVVLKANPESSKIAAGLWCGYLWTICKGMQDGDIVLSPNGQGVYIVGEVISDYYYEKGVDLQHRRKVNWFGELPKTAMSQALQNSLGAIGTVSNVTKHSPELSKLIENPKVTVTTNDETIEDPSVFALEAHLEEFLVHNWAHTELGKHYDIFENEGELVGQQYPSDTGPIDILAISKNKKELLVVELKKGRISDVVVGQIQRYMGFVQDELLEKDQSVKGVIIALEDDLRLRRALSVAKDIDFMTYQITFTLNKS